MKRSEMVLRIAECLVEPHSDDPMIEASHILKRLEKAGMLPPEAPVTKRFDLDVYTIMERFWEPENEPQ